MPSILINPSVLLLSILSADVLCLMNIDLTHVWVIFELIYRALNFQPISVTHTLCITMTSASLCVFFPFLELPSSVLWEFLAPSFTLFLSGAFVCWQSTFYWASVIHMKDITSFCLPSSSLSLFLYFQQQAMEFYEEAANVWKFCGVHYHWLRWFWLGHRPPVIPLGRVLLYLPYKSECGLNRHYVENGMQAA